MSEFITKLSHIKSNGLALNKNSKMTQLVCVRPMFVFSMTTSTAVCSYHIQ